MAQIKRGGTLVHARTKDTDSWDTLLVRSSEHIVQLPLYETLVRYDVLDNKTGKAEYKGELAESWEIVNPTTVVFKLRKGVKFHDGTEFNAEVAKWVLDREKNDPKSGGKARAAFIKNGEVVDPLTFKLNLERPSALVLANLTRATGGPQGVWFGMVSPTAVKKYGDDYATHPVGTGPIMMVEWKRDQETKFKAFPDYWRKGEDGKSLPYYDALTSKVVPDAAALHAELRAGTVHITDLIPPSSWKQVETDPSLVLKLAPWAPIRFNLVLNQHKPPFDKNMKLRQAAMYAIDRKGIADALGLGYNLPSNYVNWVPNFPGWDESLPRYDYDSEKAKALVKEAGFADGVQFPFYAIAQDPWRKPAEAVQSNFDRVGLKAVLDFMDDTTVIQRLKNLEFGATLWGSSPYLDPAHMESSLACQGAGNRAFYCNEAFDKCLVEGESLYDFDKRAEVYKRCWKILYEDALVTGVMLQPTVIVHSAKLKNVRNQGYLMDLWEAWLN